MADDSCFFLFNRYNINYMGVFSLLFNMTGGLCMFLFGMKLMSDGLQKSAGDSMRKALNFMTSNRFAGLVTGFVVTGIIQSSSAVTLIIVSFVNAGLLTLSQSIGVIMGANIGTTVTAWIVSLLGFSINISSMALPSVGIGFILSVVKWKYKSLGELIMGFGLLFLGLYYLTNEMKTINNYVNFNSLSAFRDVNFFTMLVGAGTGLLITLLIHSSSASTAIFLTMAFNNIITYEMAASMILGANIGTTIDAVLGTIGAKTAAKRAALVHILFNVFGVLWALPLLKPLLAFVNFITPGDPVGPGVTVHLAMLHTVFNTVNTVLFLPFVNQFARLVSFLIREDKFREESRHYVFTTFKKNITDTPELNIIRVEKEIRDMAGIVSSMYTDISGLLIGLSKIEDKKEAAVGLRTELKHKEEYVDEMRETLTGFLIECTQKKLNARSEQRVSQLLHVIGNIEEMSDACYIISILFEKSVRKDRLISAREMDDLIPYLNHVKEFLALLQEQLERGHSLRVASRTRELETEINNSQKRLQKLSRKRIEAGRDVKTELFFIDLVRRIEKLGDYCFDISNTLMKNN
jgi:phosphate:Na+ symporter